MGSDTKMDDPVKKGKKKMWKICRCGFGWGIFGIIIFIVGIALLVKFSEYWGDDEHWERALAYVGVAFLCLGFVLLALGLTFCVILFIVYKRLTSDHGTKTMFHAPKFEYGEAPYPQQPPYSPISGGETQSTSDASHPQPSAPPSEKAPANSGEVKVEIAEHHKF